MSLPPPAPNQAYCTVSALEAGRVDMPLDLLIDIAKPGERVDLPDLIFLLRHSSPTLHKPFLFDLGLRADPENLPVGAQAAIEKLGIKLQGQPDLRAALAKGGLAPGDVEHVCISHVHFDHTGDTSLFPASTFLLGAEAEAVIQENGPDFHGTVYAIDAPRGRTRFLDTRAWPPLGPFERALDFYGDGSVYVVDAAGHVPGHLNLLARTSADGGWVYLATDSAHDWRIIRGDAGFAHHPTAGCIHADPAKAVRHVESIRELRRDPRVRVLLTHDVPWYEENKGGPAFWPGSIESL
ncbi:Metallo-hydrolase/oxidoreductase [Pilatotrama ljubarskyi]|nr:Metallo-hydrolase/oxidoreductase [Pilatotrama ljubarskyi]